MMKPSRPAVLVTGAAGNLGRRLLPMLTDYRVVAVDMKPPDGIPFHAFAQLDLGLESSCSRLVELLRTHQASAVVHLAFVIDPRRTGVFDRERMWQINVAGTARVMEAVAEFNRMGGRVERLIVPGSVSAYGPVLASPATEDTPLAAHSLTYAVHKKEMDEVVRQRAESLGDCATWLLRPNIFVGASMQNYLVGVFRGTPSSAGSLGRWLLRRGTRLPLMLPFGEKYLENRFQFVHVDDVARLMVHLLRSPRPAAHLEVLNVAGRGEPLPLRRCIELAGGKVIRVPGKWVSGVMLRLLWEWGVCDVPPDALPYLLGSFTMDLSRMEALLGSHYQQVIRYTVEEALVDDLQSVVAANDIPARPAHYSS